MSLARHTEISAKSTKSIDDAVQQAIQSSAKTVRGITQLWIKDIMVEVENDKIKNYQINGKLTFVVEDR